MPCPLCDCVPCRCPKPAADLAEPPLRVTLTLRALPGDVPAAERLKRLLKTALRRFGFRCERCSDEVSK